MTKHQTKKSTDFFNFRLIALFAIGLVLMSYAATWLCGWYITTQGSAPPPNPSNVVYVSSVTPDEKPVDTSAPYKVPSHEPKRISIDSTGITGFVQKVGKDEDNVIVAPSNIHMAGWYTGSVLPGESGLSIIDGHVSGRYGPGIFHTLKNVTPGDIISVEFGDRSMKMFKVVRKKQLPKNEAGEYLMEKDPGIKKQLNLITCAGPFSRVENEYDSRLVVVSKLIPN